MVRDDHQAIMVGQLHLPWKEDGLARGGRELAEVAKVVIKDSADGGLGGILYGGGHRMLMFGVEIVNASVVDGCVWWTVLRVAVSPTKLSYNVSCDCRSK